jgi:hypothetical protein
MSLINPDIAINIRIARRGSPLRGLGGEREERNKRMLQNNKIKKPIPPCPHPSDSPERENRAGPQLIRF